MNFSLFNSTLGAILFSVLILWSVVWKGYGLWKSARNNQLYWYIAMLVLNTAGILPIIYIVWFQKKKKHRR